MVLAIGATRVASVTFHVMPWYASPELQEAYGADPGPYASGESCVRFGADWVPPARAGGRHRRPAPLS